MESLINEVRYAWRRILRSPFHNLLILLSLALGIGANTSVFSLANGILLKPLPYPHPERIIAVVETHSGTGEGSPSSPINFTDLRRQAHVFAHLAAWADARSLLITPGLEPARVSGAAVSADFFPALGIRFVLGRGFTTMEDRPGGPKVAVISTSLWQRRFGGSRQILGIQVNLDEEPCTVVGIVSSESAYPEGSEFWTPLALDATGSSGSSYWLSLIGRLAPGISVERAQAEVNTIAHRLAPNQPVGSRTLGFKLYLLRDLVVRNIRSALLLLSVAVAVVLLISCSNVASILLARSIGQEKEVAVRFALGCSTRQLFRVSLIETSLLSLLGGGLGLAFSALATSILVKLGGNVLPRQGEIGIDLTVLLFTLVVSLLTALFMGSLPLLRRRMALHPATILSAADRSSGAHSPFVLLAGKLTTIVEVALAVPALLAAGLLAHSFHKLMRMSPGFQADSALTLGLALPEHSYGTPERQSVLYATLVSAMRELPGVGDAGVIFPLPLSGSQYRSRVAAADRPLEDPASAPAVGVGFISPDLLAALGIPLLQGRDFTDHDSSASPPVVLISQSLAWTLWPGEPSLGRRLTLGASKNREKIVATIVGIVGDVHQKNLQEGPHLEVYRPIRQAPRPEVTLVVRSVAGSGISAGLLREKLKRIDPNLAPENFATLSDLVARSTGRERFQSFLTSLFAILALCLTGAGIFGVISFGIEQRRHEIGVRMALGATQLNIQRLLIGQVLQLLLAGFAIGLVLYLMVSRALASFLFGISRVEPFTLAAVFILVLITGGLAITRPLYRATTVDPAVALRSE